jgi:DNA replication and repair protein RecF
MENFRNHRESSFACSKNGNLFVGNNGEGKTNILEAVSYLCLTKSFFSAADTIVTQIGKPGFLVSGEFESDYGTKFSAAVEFIKEKAEKKYSLNRQPVERASDVIGTFPLVVLAPEQNRITIGGPQDRRQFVDLAVSQTSRTYLEDLIEYRRIVRQRNRLLMGIRENGRDIAGALAPWNESLVNTGSAIIEKRIEFCGEFSSSIQREFEILVGPAEHPSMDYRPSVTGKDPVPLEERKESFRQELEKRFREECQTGYSLVGPHRDEYVFGINGMELRKYASQGQHKTFLIALKLAEFNFLRERCRETPILLMDDVLSELDPFRSEKLFQMTSKVGQIFLTSTESTMVSRISFPETQWKKNRVVQGTVRDAGIDETFGEKT